MFQAGRSSCGQAISPAEPPEKVRTTVLEVQPRVFRVHFSGSLFQGRGDVRPHLSSPLFCEKIYPILCETIYPISHKKLVMIQESMLVRIQESMLVMIRRACW